MSVFYLILIMYSSTDLCNSWCLALKRCQLPPSWSGSHGSSTQPKRQAGSLGHSSGNSWRSTVSACSLEAKMLLGVLWICSYSLKTDPEERQEKENNCLTCKTRNIPNRLNGWITQHRCTKCSGQTVVPPTKNVWIKTDPKTSHASPLFACPPGVQKEVDMGSSTLNALQTCYAPKGKGCGLL